MDLQEWNSALNEELGVVNEGIRDMTAKLWKKVRGVKKQTIQKVAKKFFQKHPDLLQAVKAKFGQTQTSESIQALEEASKTQKGVMTIAIILALLSGIVKPTAASEQLTLSSASSGVSQTHYITNMEDALENMKPDDFSDSLIGSYVIDSAGNYTFIENQNQAQSILKSAQGNYQDVLIFSAEDLEGTGDVSSSQRRQGAAFQRHLANTGNTRVSQQ